MANLFLLNHSMTATQLSRLLPLIQQINPAVTTDRPEGGTRWGEILSDGSINKHEWKEILDADASGLVDISDFKKVSAKNFAELDTLVKEIGLESLTKTVPGIDRIGVKDGIPYRDAPEFLKTQEDIALTAYTNDRDTLDEILKYPDVFWNVKFIARIFEIDGMALKQLGDRELSVTIATEEQKIRVRDYAPLVAKAVKQNGMALEFTTENLRFEKPSICTFALERSPKAIAFLSRKFQNSYPECVLPALTDIKCWTHVSPDLQQDDEFVLDAVAVNHHILAKVRETSPAKLKDAELAMKFVKIDGRAYAYLDPSVQKQRPIALEAVTEDGIALFWVYDDFNDPQMVKTALTQNGLALKHAKDYWDSDALVEIAVRENPDALKFASEKLQKKFAKLAEEVRARLNAEEVKPLPYDLDEDPEE